MHINKYNIFVVILIICLKCLICFSVAKAQDVIRASGATNISIDNIGTGTYTTVTGPTIRETASGQLNQGTENIRLTLPAGFEWNTNLTAQNITISIEPIGSNNTDLMVVFNSITANEVRFSVTNISVTAGQGKGPGRVTISGLQLRPNVLTVPNVGQITNTGTTGPFNVNYGNLSTKVGQLTSVNVETTNDGNGIIVNEQNLLAGNTIEVFSIARDAGGNFIENISLESADDWILTNTTGNILTSALQSSTDRRKATFTPQKTGSARIQATKSNVILTPSGIISVLPNSTNELNINTQPSSTATAGEPFNIQPVIHLYDFFGNLTTNDNSTEVTVSIAEGEGTLLGQLTQQTEQGVITFSDLSVETAKTITLLFQSEGIESKLSSEITIEPGVPQTLIFLRQPSNALPGNSINPPIQVQLMDQYENIVPAGGFDITVTGVGGDDTLLDGDVVEETNSNGIAIFENLQVSIDTIPGSVTLSASFAGINNPVLSSPFFVLGNNELAGFAIESIGGAAIGEQEAGELFAIQLRAIDGNGNTYSDFEDTVYLTSNSNFELGEGETPTFDDGILTNLNVILTTSGETNIQVENSELNRTGQSNQFYVWPTIVNVDESSVESIPQQITADGNSSSELIVILKDSYGNMLDTGGENVFIHTNKGTLGNDETTTQAEDLGNGLYSAILTSSTITETATVEAYIDEVKIDEVQVEFVAGLLAAFNIEVPVENDEPVTQMAGVPFQIVIQAMDENNNIISDFNSNLVFSTNSSFLAGETVHMDSGNFVHSVSLSKADSNVTLSVTQDNINDVQGISELFGVIANIPAQSNSMVNASEVILQNDGSSQALITIILRDLYNNHINQEYSVTIEPEQLEEDGLPSSGSPNASISSVTFNQELGEYQSTLTASNITELIAFNAFFEGGPSDLSKTLIDEVININIVYPNQWQSGGGPPANRVDWLNEDNWSLGRIPTDLDFVIIPGGLTDYPNLDVNIILGSLTIEDGGILTLFGGNSISITSTLTVNGLLDIKDNTILNIGSSFIGSGTFTGGESVSVIINGNLTVNSFLARTAESVVRLQGNQPRSISTANFLAERLEIRNELLATSNLIDLSVLDISSGNSFELDTNGDKVLDVSANVIGEGNLILNDNQLTLRGNYNLSNIDASDAKIVFEGTTEQEIINLSLMKNAEINNPENVRFFDDVIIDGNLNLIRGIMVINSGKSLIAQNQIYEGGALLFRRSISNVRGWRMMTAPLATSFSDFFDGLTLQGIPGTSFEDRQPNLLYYDETVTGTDNQRWRAPGSAGNQLQSGRGYFFYVFGNPDDEDYNDILPKTLTVNGQDNIAGGSEFEFMVTYTSEADTGWNLLGNPFGAAINWNSLGWTKNNIDETMYVWDSDANNGDGEYRVFNGITGSHDGIIPPFQAFWVKANQVDPEMIFNKSSLSTGGVFYKKGTRSKVAEITDNSSPLVTFQLDKDEMKNSTYFMFSDSARAGKDKYDGYKLKSMGDTYLEIYSHLENGSQLSINNLPKKSILPFQIPIGVGGYINGNAINGEFALSWPLISKVPETWLLELIDNETNTIIDMTDQEVYNFTISGDQPKIAAHKYGQPDMQIMKSITGGNRFTFKITPDKPNESDIPAKFSLEQNYPNPFNPSTTILFALPEASFVKLVIYDILGRQVSVLASRDYEAGYHEVIWDASRFASGLYIYRIQAGKNIKTKKMTVIN